MRLRGNLFEEFKLLNWYEKIIMLDFISDIRKIEEPEDISNISEGTVYIRYQKVLVLTKDKL